MIMTCKSFCCEKKQEYIVIYIIKLNFSEETHGYPLSSRGTLPLAPPPPVYALEFKTFCSN